MSLLVCKDYDVFMEKIYIYTYVNLYKYISAVKRLIASKIKVFFFLHNVCVCVRCIYKYKTHTCIYFRKIGYVYILNVFVYNRIYININRHVNIFKIYTVCVCIYIHIINIHRTHTHIMQTKTFICM